MPGFVLVAGNQRRDAARGRRYACFQSVDFHTPGSPAEDRRNRYEELSRC